MKCIKNTATGEIKRETDDNVAAMVAKGWAYCGKKIWKETTRVKKLEKVEKPIKSGKEEPASKDHDPSDEDWPTSSYRYRRPKA